MELHQQPVDLTKVIEKALDENRKLAKEKNISIHYKPKITVQVIGDDMLLEKSFSETINNAVKFSTGREVAIETFDEGNRVLVKITNAGEEIPEEKLQRMTEAFGMAEQHMDKNAGLGLAIVSACQNLINGELNIESKTGMVTVTLGFRKE
jgi:signal transduction histidine kinase